jgi:hypothetical protein
MDNEAELMACEVWNGELDELHRRLVPFVGRRENQGRVRGYIMGLLGQAERKNGWQLAESM